MVTNSASSGDFNHQDRDVTAYPLVSFLTYSRIVVSAEEIERQLLAAYGPGRLPGTESRRRSNMGLSPRRVVPRTCAQCGEPLTWRFRFCSQACWGEWREDQPDRTASAESLAEMRAALRELGASIEDDEW